MEVREAVPEEYEQAGRVLVAAYAEVADPGDPGWAEHLALMADVEGRAGRTVVLVAVEGETVLGTATIELDDVVGDDDPSLPPDEAALRMLGVDPAARRRGVGRAIVEEVIDRARRADRRSIRLRTLSVLTAARSLYASLGFELDPSLDMAVDEGLTLIGYRLAL